MGEAELRILINARNDSAKAFRGVERSYTSLGQRAQGFAKEHRAALAIAAGATTAFAALSIKAASDEAEARNKVNEVFGQSSAEIEAFAASASTSLGTSRAAALEATGTIGNLLTAIGQTPQEAAAMSSSLVQLSADLGSFNNLGTEEVLVKIRAGLVGEVEPLRTLGVQLSAATVEQEAYTSGLATLGAELTEGQKIQARYQLILAQTATAQGDFARTSDGVANSSKIVQAQLADAAADIGTAFLPAVMAILGVARDLLEAFNSLPEEARNFGAGLIIVAGAVAGLTAAAGALNLALLANPIFLAGGGGHHCARGRDGGHAQAGRRLQLGDRGRQGVARSRAGTWPTHARAIQPRPTK